LKREIEEAEEGGEYEKIEELLKTRKEALGRLRKMILEFLIGLGPLDWSLVLDFFEVKEKKMIGSLLKGLGIPLSLEEIEKIMRRVIRMIICCFSRRVSPKSFKKR